GDSRSICPVDPRDSAHGPLRAGGMVQWRHAGVRDSPSAAGGWRNCIARLYDRYVDSRLFQTSWLASIETGGLRLSLAVDPDRLGHGEVWGKVLVGLYCRSQHGGPLLPSRAGRRGRVRARLRYGEGL